MSQRLVPIDAIPMDLWRGTSDLLILPAQLSAAYRTKIELLGLTDLATQHGDEDGPAGGMKDEATRHHFARRFPASCGRIQLAVLDPKNELLGASDLMISSFAGGKVTLLDAPCGAGAAFTSVLTTIAALRRASCIPSDPLEVSVIGGDFSPYALDLSRRMHTALRDELSDVSIESSFVGVDWDAKDTQKTVDLLKVWTQECMGARIKLAIAANFSDFLGHRDNFKECRRHLEDIFHWTDIPNTRFAWIEPQTNTAKSVFQRLMDLIASIPLRLLKQAASEESSTLPPMTHA